MVACLFKQLTLIPVFNAGDWKSVRFKPKPIRRFSDPIGMIPKHLELVPTLLKNHVPFHKALGVAGRCDVATGVLGMIYLVSRYMLLILLSDVFFQLPSGAYWYTYLEPEMG